MSTTRHTLSALSIMIFFTFSAIAVSATGDFVFYGNEPQFSNNIVLTIDDASIEENVRAMFDLLRTQGITATFFPNTRYITQQDPQLWQDIVNANFEIGYHTRNHTSYMTPEELTADFNLFQEEIRALLQNPSYNIRFVRPPNGTWNADWLAWARANQLITVRWNITSVTEDMPYIAGVLQNQSSGGHILLLHTGINDVQWLQNHLPSLVEMRDAQHHPYRMTSITQALID